MIGPGGKAAVAVAFVALAVLAGAAAATAAVNPGSAATAIVSLGDSFISGGGYADGMRIEPLPAAS